MNRHKVRQPLKWTYSILPSPPPSPLTPTPLVPLLLPIRKAYMKRPFYKRGLYNQKVISPEYTVRKLSFTKSKYGKIKSVPLLYVYSTYFVQIQDIFVKIKLHSLEFYICDR